MCENKLNNPFLNSLCACPKAGQVTPVSNCSLFFTNFLFKLEGILLEKLTSSPKIIVFCGIEGNTVSFEPFNSSVNKTGEKAPFYS